MLTQDLKAIQATLEPSRIHLRSMGTAYAKNPLAERLQTLNTALKQNRIRLGSIGTAYAKNSLAGRLQTLNTALEQNRIRLGSIGTVYAKNPLAERLQALNTALERSRINLGSIGTAYAKNPLAERLKTLETALAEVHAVDFDHFPSRHEPLGHGEGRIGDEDPEFGDGSRVAQVQTEEDKSWVSRHTQTARELFEVIWRIDLLLLGTLSTALREAIGEAVSNAAKDVLLYLWLLALVQAPSPPPTPAVPGPDAFRIPVHIIEEFVYDRPLIDEASTTPKNQGR